MEAGHGSNGQPSIINSGVLRVGYPVDHSLLSRRSTCFGFSLQSAPVLSEKSDNGTVNNGLGKGHRLEDRRSRMTLDDV